MADTADRRSLVLFQDPKNVAQRRRYRARIAAGYCGMCGKTEVRKRSTCYDCGDRGHGYSKERR